MTEGIPNDSGLTGIGPQPTRKQWVGSRSAKFSRLSGFSLIEVTLAIGIVSFALLAIVGLLPVGLKSVQTATEQAGAAEILKAISANLRAASSLDRTNFVGKFGGKDFGYQIGQRRRIETYWNDLTLEGSQEDEFSSKRLSAILWVEAPVDAWSSGHATISVAWSAQANPEWDPVTGTWGRADGFLISGIQFLPKR